MEFSSERKNLFEAKTKANMKLKNLVRENEGIDFNTISLAEVIEQVRPVLVEFGLDVQQAPIAEEGKAGVQTSIWHSSGEYVIYPDFLIEVNDFDDLNNMQATAATITSCRKIAYLAALGIAAKDPTEDEIKKPKKKKIDKASKEQLEELEKLKEEAKKHKLKKLVAAADKAFKNGSNESVSNAIVWVKGRL